MSKVELASLADVSPNSITNWEKAKNIPRDENIECLAQALEYPVDFFFQGEAPLVNPETVSFRALSRMPAPQRDQVIGAAGLAVELDKWIDERFERPEPKVPDLDRLEPATAAEAIRSEWGLGHGPISNLVHVAERAGIRVYSLAPAQGDDGLGAIDALSMWWDDTPFIFLNTSQTVERVRHSLGHEIGHLVLHGDGGPTGQTAEKEANRFAGNLLLPTESLIAEAKRYFSFDEILEAKKSWKVSALAYVYRMNEEGLLDKWRYKELCIKLRRDYGSAEPSPVRAPETSQVLRKVFSHLQAEGGRAAVASDLGITVDDLDSLIFSQTLTPIDGAGGEPDSQGSPPDLHLLE
jgi:Zn-dependent peptidase ImmA (M78 family)/DNA-binding XRE family transcriptional regulator